MGRSIDLLTMSKPRWLSGQCPGFGSCSRKHVGHSPSRGCLRGSLSPVLSPLKLVLFLLLLGCHHSRKWENEHELNSISYLLEEKQLLSPCQRGCLDHGSHPRLTLGSASGSTALRAGTGVCTGSRNKITCLSQAHCLCKGNDYFRWAKLGQNLHGLCPFFFNFFFLVRLKTQHLSQTKHFCFPASWPQVLPLPSREASKLQNGEWTSV